jgi:D-alanine transfer protein
MKWPHLVSALVVSLLALGLVIGFDMYARTVEDRYVHALATDAFHQKSLGSAIQKATLRQPDLLPMYGSSEILTGGQYNSTILFGSYPTGFDTSWIGFVGQPLLCMTLQLAGDASELRGKKVVLVVDRSTVMGAGNWPGNFSALEANELVFSSDLTFDLKQRIARQILNLGIPISQDSLLEFALPRLAGDNLEDRAVYYVLFPLGKMHLWIMRLQDHWEILNYVRDHPNLQTAVQRRPTVIHWASLAAKVAADVTKSHSNNPFDMSNVWWDNNKDRLLTLKNSTTDAKFARSTEAGGAWTNLELTLAVLQKLGAHTLLVGIPLNGRYYDYLGTTKQTRTAYYNRLSRVGYEYGAKVITLQDHEYDKYFVDDTGDHASAEGWVYIDQIIDRFYHNALP